MIKKMFLKKVKITSHKCFFFFFFILGVVG